jgi:hypothetical protein
MLGQLSACVMRPSLSGNFRVFSPQNGNIKALNGLDLSHVFDRCNG